MEITPIEITYSLEDGYVGNRPQTFTFDSEIFDPDYWDAPPSLEVIMAEIEDQIEAHKSEISTYCEDLEKYAKEIQEDILSKWED